MTYSIDYVVANYFLNNLCRSRSRLGWMGIVIGLNNNIFNDKTAINGNTTMNVLEKTSEYLYTVFFFIIVTDSI